MRRSAERGVFHLMGTVEKICVIGLGYIGLPTASILATKGYKVLGVDIDENEVARVALGEPAVISPRGAAELHVNATFVRAEPLVVPKRSLTNSAAERVDVRVLQLIYALPPSDAFRVGQQIDAFIPAKPGAAATTPAKQEN